MRRMQMTPCVERARARGVVRIIIKFKYASSGSYAEMHVRFRDGNYFVSLARARGTLLAFGLVFYTVRK